MCGIICCGPNTSFSQEDLKKSMMFISKRGPDYNTCIEMKDSGFWVAITQLMIVGNDNQPILYENLAIQGNIEIYA